MSDPNDLPFDFFEDSDTGEHVDEGHDGGATFDRRVHDRRRKIKILLSLFGIVVGFAGFWFALNIVQLWRAMPPELYLEVSGPSATDGSRYVPQLDWTSGPPADFDGGHPLLKIAGDVLVPGTSGRARVVSGEPVVIQVVVGTETALGTHSGDLTLAPVSASSVTGDTLTLPIEIEVIGGFFSPSWVTARWGLLGTGVLVLVLYAFAYVVVPRPKGVVWIQDEDDCRLPSRVILRPTAAGFLMPWRLSWIPFRTLARWAGVRKLARIGGGLLFLDSRSPRFEVSTRPTGWTVEMARAKDKDTGTEASAGERFRRESRTFLVSGAHVYRIRSNSAKNGVRIRYSGSYR